MSLAPGGHLGPYEVIAQIGVGGMGEVWRATDTNLKRAVALKVLPEAVAADRDRLARFQREAEVLAALNHPNIAHIHGLEKSGGTTALVMELVEGPTLADRIARGPLLVDEALAIAKQIAEALETAHELGIIHRDLKPANIKVREDGMVKVLDFGLAKAMEPATASGDLSHSPTITSPAMTQAGVILGTAAYMSPEQARGKPVDKRSDIWAFGCVLYEMLTGARTFKGDDVADTIAAVLRQEVDWTALPASTPASVRRLLARCLERDVKRRLRDIGEARMVLNDSEALSINESASVEPLAPLRPPRTLWRRAIPVALATIVAAALGGTAAWRLKPSPPLKVAQLEFTLPRGQLFPPLSGMRRLIDLSPDGEQMVYVGEPSGLYLRSMSQLRVDPIQGTEGHTVVTDPTFSPDGRFVAFYAQADRTLKKIAVTGGAAVTICPADYPFGISWETDGTIVFGQGRKGILRVSEDGGEPNVLVRVKDGEVAHGPHLLPDGQRVLFTLATGTTRDGWDSARIVVHALTSGKETTVIEGGSDARYLPTGHLVYALSGIVYASAFDVGRLELQGASVPMLRGVGRSWAGETGVTQLSISNTGSLIYLPGPALALSGLVDVALIDRDGTVERLKLAPGPYQTPRVSPNGTHIAFGTDNGNEANLYTYDLSGATGMQLQSLARGRFPIWTSDSKSVVFQSEREGDFAIWREPYGGGHAERLTTPKQGESHAPESWSPKGDTLLFTVKRGLDESLWSQAFRDGKPNGPPAPFGDVHSSKTIGAVFSPDGQRVAYMRTERDRTTIYVRPFPAGTESKLVATGSDNPHEVVWSSDGKELFYNPRPLSFEAVSVTTEPTFTFGNAVVLPRLFQTSPSSERRSFDIVQRGAFAGKFVGLIRVEGLVTPIIPQIQVVLNWFEELKRLVPTD